MNESEYRDSFVVYRSFVESIKKFHQLGVLTSDNVASLFYAMSSLALDGEEAELAPIEDAVFTQLRPQIEANREKAAKARQGGRPEAQVSIEELNAKYAELGNWDAVASFYGLSRQSVYNIRARGVKQNVNVKKPNDNENGNVNENVESTRSPCEREAAEPPSLQTSKKSPFIPPTVEEVAAYCRERRNSIDAAAFVAFYSSKGWVVGKAKMKDWRQAVITWERRESGSGARPAAPEYKTWKAPPPPSLSDGEREQMVGFLEKTLKDLAQKKAARTAV